MKREIKDNWIEWHLSQHFKLKEFCVSEKRPDLAAKILPTVDQVNSLTYLCRFGLEPIREKFGPISVTRGLTTEELNAAVGGVNDSQHQHGEAADILIKGHDMEEVFFWCKDLLRWEGELIFYPGQGHLHIALPSIFVKVDQFIKGV